MIFKNIFTNNDFLYYKGGIEIRLFRTELSFVELFKIPICWFVVRSLEKHLNYIDFFYFKRIVHEFKFFRFLKIPSYKSNLL